MRWLGTVVAGFALATLAACGGGGGESSGAGGVSTSPVVYAGNTNPAVITANNAGFLAANVMGSGDVSGSLSVGRTGPAEDVAEISHRLIHSIRVTTTRALWPDDGGRFGLAIPVDETRFCDSGTIRIVGTLSDDGTGTVSITYEACRTGDDAVSGSASMTVSAIAFVAANEVTLTDFTINATRLALRGPGLSVDLSGSQRAQLDVATNIETNTVNLVLIDNPTGRLTKTENLVYVDDYDSIFSTYAQTVSGRVYDSVHGFVDISTDIALAFSSASNEFPDSGRLRLTGAIDAIIRVTALSTSLVSIELDLDANGSFETAATLLWIDLGRNAGTDLADTDGDTMHNSWEVARGLDPNSPADAAADSDGDGSSNLNEYRAGSDPGDPGSTPLVVGLSIAASDAPDPVTTGNALTYTFTVSNSTTISANAVVLSVTLPASVNLVSTAPGQGSCAGTAPVVCNLGMVHGFANIAVLVVVIPTVEGLMTTTASVATTSFDPTSADNAINSTTLVGQPLAGVQAQINAAAPGATITVNPGVYFGGLDFGARDITLQSASGPALTTIHAAGGTAVQMGPGGTIRGFTITGSGQPAIRVNGAGSLISGNVFIGNAGVVIEGNNVSPVIERNVFRANDCSNASRSGLIAPFNNSSPSVLNNIFENNTCFAIYLGLPVGNTPQVLNNTFVGNFGAVKVDRRVSQTTQVYRNNLIKQNATGLEAEFGTDAENPVWANNLVFGNTVDYRVVASQTGVNGNISEDPLLVDQPGGNYRLQADSPAVDAGSATGAPASDFDGTLRPQGAGFDIGAYEAIP